MKPLPLTLLIVGAVISLGAPLVGLVITVASMMGAFHHLGQNGISDPHALANDIGHVLTSTMAGFIVSVGIGLPLVIAGLVVHFVTRNRPGSIAAQ